MEPRFSQLHPDTEVESLLSLIRNEQRASTNGRPWVFTNMISSADGATAVDGLSGGLGAQSDSKMLVALRSVADIILVGSGTVTAEDYGPARLSEELRRDRVDAGQEPVPRIAIVSAGLSLDPESRLFSDPTSRPLVLTISEAPGDRLDRLADVADIEFCGSYHVDLTRALDHLDSRGYAKVLCEGGPSLNGALVAADLIDEWNITYSPLLAAGDSKRAAVSAPQHPARAMGLERVLAVDDFLFCRYLRRR